MCSNMNEIGNMLCSCEVCGKAATNQMSTGMSCRLCGKMYCHEHASHLGLCYMLGGECSYVCNECIDKNKLRVIDPNHPYYMKYKGV